MNSIAKHCSLVVLIAQFAGVFTLDCTNSAGISYEECGPPSGGGGPGISRELLPKCVEQTFNGPDRKGYEYSNSDFELVITEISGGELIIQNFKCSPGDVCKVAVIQDDVSVPVSITMNKAKFAFVSASAVSVKFYIDDNCGSVTDPCEDAGYESFGPRWVKQVTVNMRWEECRQYCEVTLGGRMFTVKSKEAWDDIKSHFNGQFWLGFKQTTQFTYTWSKDGEVFTMNNEGEIIEYDDWMPWVSGSPDPNWDLNSGQDNKDCVSTNHVGWTEKLCTSQQRCLCDCTL